ncbi:MAG: hypothetical protein COA78_19480 [Blastopirellula sp.]|nr:MAG: hypothetical protein COA78_19480 [Blastopirellula sp.]
MQRRQESLKQNPFAASRLRVRIFFFDKINMIYKMKCEPQLSVLSVPLCLKLLLSSCLSDLVVISLLPSLAALRLSVRHLLKEFYDDDLKIDDGSDADIIVG